MSEQDDLARWADDDLVRALRAPGTAAELADEEQYVAAFRTARGSTPTVRALPARTVGRLGAGGTAVVVTVALTSGMAAAYTGHLPDPVQQIAHSVIGAPAPTGGHGRAGAGPARPGRVLSPVPPGSTATSTPSSGTTPSATSTPTGGDTGQPTAGPSASAHVAPPPATPTGDASSTSTTTATAGTPGGMTAAGGTHRAGVGETVPLTSTVTATDGLPLANHPVTLQVRGLRQWRSVAETTTDATGVASAVTPPLTRSALFRWHTDHHIHSTRWLVRMVPALSAAADVNGSTTVLSATALGGRAGDPVQLLRRADHVLSVVRDGVLGQDGSVSFPVDTPGRRAVYVVRLPSTPVHTGARARVLVVPPAVASVAASAATHRVTVGGSITLTGTVRAADGSGLAGSMVRLQVRGPRRWLGVGSATTDAAGTVAIATPSARRTAVYRLRVASGVHSAPWRLAMVPALSATTRPDGAGVDVVATALGGRAGDRVLLLRRMSGRLVTVARAPLGADGKVSFPVTRRKRSTTYVVRLVGTQRHTAATARVTVAGTG